MSPSLNSSQSAQLNTKMQRGELLTPYSEAQALAVDLCATVEFFYRKDPDAASKRTKCQAWGVVYVYEDGTAVPPPTPPPPGP